MGGLRKACVSSLSCLVAIPIPYHDRVCFLEKSASSERFPHSGVTAVLECFICSEKNRVPTKRSHSRRTDSPVIEQAGKAAASGLLTCGSWPSNWSCFDCADRGEVTLMVRMRIPEHAQSCGAHIHWSPEHQSTRSDYSLLSHSSATNAHTAHTHTQKHSSVNPLTSGQAWAARPAAGAGMPPNTDASEQKLIRMRHSLQGRCPRR